MTKRKLLALLLLLTLLSALYAGRFYFIGTSSALPLGYSNADFGIAEQLSSQDKDGDGLDDQTDILQGARAYIATNPVYKSKYYEGGYPDDHLGVCTDVVAQALLAAGYDLQQLVAEDMAARPEAYAVAEPDARIDFRRVANLQVYFAGNALTLDTDVQNIAAWQGGDIVIFKKHIGIVSNLRNANGVPYLIHHANPFQAAYEEDVLERRRDIVGHYRISE